MIAEGVPIKRETYVAILMDRELSTPVVVHSPAGGMDIETVAKKQPHLLFKVLVMVKSVSVPCEKQYFKLVLLFSTEDVVGL